METDSTLSNSLEYEDEWIAFCKADYEDFKLKNPPPFVAHFWSGSVFYNALEDWGREWNKHCRVVGEKWWNGRGFTVTDWPYREPITVSPLNKS